jgi:hypothetical protein
VGSIDIFPACQQKSKKSDLNYMLTYCLTVLKATSDTSFWFERFIGEDVLPQESKYKVAIKIAFIQKLKIVTTA